MSVNKIKTQLTVHTFVALAFFLDNPNNLPRVHHIDRNRLKDNLIWQSNKEAQQRKPIQENNMSGHKGVCYDIDTNRWQSYINIDGVKIHLGRFKNKQDAIDARVKKANEVFGINV